MSSILYFLLLTFSSMFSVPFVCLFSCVPPPVWTMDHLIIVCTYTSIIIMFTTKYCLYRSVKYGESCMSYHYGLEERGYYCSMSYSLCCRPSKLWHVCLLTWSAKPRQMEPYLCSQLAASDVLTLPSFAVFLQGQNSKTPSLCLEITGGSGNIFIYTSTLELMVFCFDIIITFLCISLFYCRQKQ